MKKPKVGILFSKSAGMPSIGIVVDKHYIAGAFFLRNLHITGSSEHGYKFDVHFNDCLIHASIIMVDGIIYGGETPPKVANQIVQEWYNGR